MNRYAQIELVESFEKVRYYSVRFESTSQNLFDEFINEFEESEYLDELKIMVSWLEQIGDTIGASIDYKIGGKNLFRHERSASALPPAFVGGNLRLYCHVLNEPVVFLFSGGVKTTRRAQDCPNVAMHFQLANELSDELDRALKEGEIS